MTMYVAGWIGKFHFFISTPFPPPPPYRRPSYVVFVISTIEDCIQKVENEFG